MTDALEIDPEVTAGLTSLTKDELTAAAEQFGVEAKRSLSKGDLVQLLAEDGITLELIRGFNNDQAEDDEPVEEFDEAPVAEEEEGDDTDLVLVRMIRANNTYQIRGYTFKQGEPFALVKEKDADYLVEVDGGFRVASPKEAREFYS